MRRLGLSKIRAREGTGQSPCLLLFIITGTHLLWPGHIWREVGGEEKGKVREEGLAQISHRTWGQLSTERGFRQPGAVSKGAGDMGTEWSGLVDPWAGRKEQQPRGSKDSKDSGLICGESGDMKACGDRMPIHVVQPIYYREVTQGCVFY